MKETFLASLPLLLLLLHNADTQGVHCPRLKPLYRGDIKMSSQPPYEAGTLANFTCDQGLKLRGLDNIKCKDDGTWSGKTPLCMTKICKRDKGKLEKSRRCRKKCRSSSDCKGTLKTCQCDGWCGPSCFNPKSECPLLTKPQNGVIYENGTSYGSEVSYVCEKGFELNGASKRTCLSNRKWSGSKPICYADCPPLKKINNGIMIGNGRKYGSAVSYRCDEGYNLIGPSKRNCTSNGTWSGYSPICAPLGACGYTVVEKKLGKIIGGTDADLGEWPWQVVFIEKVSEKPALRFQDKESLIGGGSIINDKWVLSAAHVFPRDFYIAAGMASFISEGQIFPDHIQIYQVAAIFVHPKFNSSNYDYDVALVRIGDRLKPTANNNLTVYEKVPGGKFTWAQYVRPVCLPCMKGNILRPVNLWPNFDTNQCPQTEESIFPSFARPGSSLIVTGFGATRKDGGKSSNAKNLQQGEVTVINDTKCAEDIPDIRTKYEIDASYTDRMFCASGGTKRTDSCQGDSGGPVVMKVGLANNTQVEYWTQLGIVSWGSVCAENYGYYISVPSIINWLWTTLDEEKNGAWSDWSLCSTTCGGGIKSRYKNCTGTCEGRLQEGEICNTEPCNGRWSECDEGKKWKKNCLWGTRFCGIVYKDC